MLQIDLTSPLRRKKVGNKLIHTPNGWPHYSSRHPYHCICLDTCCQRENGCVCKFCVCKRGIPHGTPAEVQAAYAEKMGRQYTQGNHPEGDTKGTTQ